MSESISLKNHIEKQLEDRKVEIKEVPVIDNEAPFRFSTNEIERLKFENILLRESILMNQIETLRQQAIQIGEDIVERAGKNNTWVAVMDIKKDVTFCVIQKKGK